MPFFFFGLFVCHLAAGGSGGVRRGEPPDEERTAGNEVFFWSRSTEAGEGERNLGSRRAPPPASEQAGRAVASETAAGRRRGSRVVQHRQQGRRAHQHVLWPCSDAAAFTALPR